MSVETTHSSEHAEDGNLNPAIKFSLQRPNWFKSLTKRKKSSNKENNQNANIDTSVSTLIPSESSTEASTTHNNDNDNNSSQSQTSNSYGAANSTNFLSWVTMFRKRALQRRRVFDNEPILPPEHRLMTSERRAVSNDYVIGLPNLDMPPEQMYIYSHVFTTQQQQNFVMARVHSMASNQIESPWLIQENSPNMEHLIMLNAQVLMNK